MKILTFSLFAALISLINACGKESNSELNASKSSVACSYSINGQTVKGNSKASCDALKQIAAANTKTGGGVSANSSSSNGSSVQCAFSINGKNYKGNSQAECDKLRQELGIALPTFPSAATLPALPTGAVSQVACAYNINGVLREGKTAAECDKLKQELAASFPQPSAPVLTPSPASSTASDSQVSCAYNINGVLRKGSSQAECDQIKKELGL